MRKVIKFSLSLFLIIAMLFSTSGVLSCKGILGDFHSKAADNSIKIDTSLLKAGQDISITAEDGITLIKWYVNDQWVADGSYAPCADDYEKWIRAEAYSDDELIAEDRVYFSKLPVLYINTDDGAAITSKAVYKSGTMSVQNNGTTAYTDFNGAIEIKGRGNSTWNWVKKPYKIKLGSKTDMFGMGKNKHWVLLANYLDESLMRNTTAANISQQLGLETMSSVWVDVILNGSYAGNYQFCEHIRIGENRIDIFDWESYAEDVAGAVYKGNKSTLSKTDKANLEDLLQEDLSWVTTGKFVYNEKEYIISDYCELDNDISGGYLFESSAEYDEPSKFTTNRGLYVMLKSPEFLYTNTEMMDYVSQYWQNLENAYTSEDGYVNINGTDHHYSQLVDIDSAVSYWLVMEIMGNDDAVYKSRYFYLDRNSKLKFGPVWDFDWGCASITVNYSPQGWKISRENRSQNFYKEFLDDPLFISRATEKYWEIHDYLLSVVNNDGLMDNWYDYIYESAMTDHTRWPRSLSWSNTRGFVNDYNTLQTYLRERIEWLDEQFSSEEALLKSLYTPYSAKPYEKADDILDISVINGEADSAAAYAPADFAVYSKDGFDLSVNINDDSTKSINVYVNGLYDQTIDVSESENITVSIGNDVLDNDAYRKNVISLIAKNGSRKTTARNFVTVAIEDPCIKAHIPGEWITDKEPTNKNEGSKHNECINCGKIIDTEAIPVKIPAGTVKEVNYTPEKDTHNTFEIKVEGRASFVQFVELSHGNGTRSYDRFSQYAEIASYDKDGNEVDSQSRYLSYEIWTIYTNLSIGETGIRCKYGRVWESLDDLYCFTYDIVPADAELISAELAATSGSVTGAVAVTIVTGPDAENVQIKMDDGSTCTYNAEKATVNEDGNLVFVGKAWANHTGECVFTIRIFAQDKWVDAGTLTYTVKPE